MHLRVLLSTCCFVFLSFALQAQDIHFTQYYMSPMTLNPANIGAFEGTVRVGGIYRDQWGSVISRKYSYKTPSAWADAPIITGFRRQDWVGVGFMFFSDKAGAGGLKHTAAKLGASYHLALDKKANTVLTIGAQYGMAGRSLVNPNELQFEDGLIDGKNKGIPYGVSQEPVTQNAEPKVDFSDVDAGVLFKSRLNKQMDFSLGFSMFHIGQGNYSLLSAGGGGNSVSKIARRMMATGQFNIKLNDRFGFGPTFLYQTMSGADEILLQALGNYLFNEEKDITLHFGLSYRMRDALSPIIGFQKGPLRVGLAYDVNTSDLNSVSRYRGGFELAANYIVKIYKPSVAKPKILCPRF